MTKLAIQITFLDALFFVEMARRSAQLRGAWPTANYTFAQSWAVTEDQFIGLALDEHNQAQLTDTRITAWVQQLLHEFSEQPTQ